MPDPQSNFSGVDDAQLQALYAQLSSPVTSKEYKDGGLGGKVPGIPEDWFQDPIKGTRNKGSILNRAEQASVLQQYNWHKQSKKEMAKRRAFIAAKNKAINQYHDQRAQRMEQVKQELLHRQTQSKINAYFNSDSMKGLYDTLENQHLQNSLAQITQQYANQNRDAAFQTAGQGLTGSSVDAERRGTIQQAQDTSAIQAQGEAQKFASGVKGQNEQLRQGLINTTNDANPAAGASFDQQLQGISNRTSQMGQDYSNQMQTAQLDQYGMNLQSQAMGNLLSNYGNLYRTGQYGAAYGGSGSAF